MTINKNYIFTDNGARLYKVSSQNKNAKLNWLFVPCPGLGSESLIDLVMFLDGKIDATLWLMDHPNDGSNRNNSYDFANWDKSITEAVIMLNKPAIVGHSTSGMMLQSLPQLEHLASALVLIDTAPDMSWKNKFNTYMQQYLTPEIESVANKHSIYPSDETLRELLLSTIQFSFEPSSFDMAHQMIKKLFINNKIAEWSDQNFDPVYKAKFIPKSLATLIIGGELDKIIPLSMYMDNQKYIRDNILIKLITGGSHYPWFENPTGVMDAFMEFKSNFKI